MTPTPEEIATLRKSIERARDHVFELARTGCKAWTMCIPAQDDDSDMLLCAALDAADKALDALSLAQQQAREAEWQPISTAPKDGTWLLVRGDSGYINGPCRVHIARYQPDYHPWSPWQTSEACDFIDDGGQPTHWAALAPLPQSEPTEAK
jgi:hypothetical protein